MAFNFAQTYQIVKTYLSSKEKPQFVLVLVSPPGQGKTSLVKGIAEELGLRLVTVPCASITRQTFTLSFILENQLTTMTLDALTDPNTILFLEELDRTPVNTLPTLLPLLAGRVMGSERVTCHIVATANNTKKIQALDPALPSRLIFVEMETEVHEIFTYLTQKYAHSLGEVGERALTALRFTCDQITPNSDLFNPRLIENLLQATITLPLHETNMVLEIFKQNLPDNVYQVFANHFLYTDIPSPTNPKVLEFLKVRNPSGKHFFALRQLVTHIATCGKKDCTHPSITNLIRVILDASPTLVDTFATAIFELPVNLKVNFINSISSYQPSSKDEKDKHEALKQLISTIMAYTHRRQ